MSQKIKAERPKLDAMMSSPALSDRGSRRGDGFDLDRMKSGNQLRAGANGGRIDTGRRVPGIATATKLSDKGMRVSDIGNLKEELIANQIDLVILAVPSTPAQKIVDEVVAAGVQGILSFAPTHIDAPPNVYVRSEDMSMELEYLTYALVNQPDK